MNKYYTDSRGIRKLINDGKTSSEIFQELGLSVCDIQKRITSQYSERIANSILGRLSENDNKKTCTSDKAIVVDTSALGAIGAVDLILSYPKVILLVDTVREMDKYKHDSTVFGKNVRKLLSKTARDFNNNFSEIVDLPKVRNYTDETVLSYCKGKNVVLYTADNAMATIARGYKIEYILAEDIVEDEYRTEKKSSNIDSEEIQVPTVSTTIESKTTLINSEMLGNNLVLNFPDTTKIKYIVLDENMHIKSPTNGINFVFLKKGYTVLTLTYKLVHGGLCISKYEITEIQSVENSIFLGAEKNISDITSIEELDFPKKVLREIRNYFTLVRKEQII